MDHLRPFNPTTGRRLLNGSAEDDGIVNPDDGVKAVWLDLPADVRTAVAGRLGAPVVGFEPAAGGFSDGVVGLVATASTKVFIKAVPAKSAAADDYRTESAVNEALPGAVPTPRLRFSFEHNGWVLLCFDALDGRHPREPWRRAELRRVLDALNSCGAALSSFDTRGLPTVADRMGQRCTTWRDLAGTGTHGRLSVTDLSPWERRHLDRLAQVEAGWQHHIDGGQLLHFDLRFDNLMIARDQVWFLDWGRACAGPRWVDLVCLLLESDLGVIDPEATLLSQLAGAAADPAAVDAFLVALASNWRFSADQAPPAHAPQLQSRRARSRDQTVAWLGRRWP